MLQRYESTPYLHKIIVLLLIVSGLLYLGYEDEIVPSQIELEDALVASQTVDNELRKLEEVNKTYVSIQAEHRIATEEMDTLKKILPEDPEIEALLAGLSLAAKQAGVVIISFTPDRTKSSSTVTTSSAEKSKSKSGESEDSTSREQSTNGAPLAYLTPIKIEVTGTFNQIVSFYDRALSLNRIMRLGSFEIELATGEDQNFTTPRKLTASSEFIAYSQRRVVALEALPLNQDPYGVKERREKTKALEQKEFTLNEASMEPLALMKLDLDDNYELD